MFQVKTDWNKWVFAPLKSRWAGSPVFPNSWRRVLRGERRTYETSLRQSDCFDRLSANVSANSPSSFKASDIKAIGLVEVTGFRIVLRGGIAGEQGLVPMLYGEFEGGQDGTVIHAFQGVPVVVGMGVFGFTFLSAFLCLIGPIASFVFGNSLTGDFAFDVMILVFTCTSLLIVSGWMWLIGKDWDMPRFEFLAQTLEARRVDVDQPTKSTNG
jgi:hypothetical protein